MRQNTSTVVGMCICTALILSYRDQQIHEPAQCARTIYRTITKLHKHTRQCRVFEISQHVHTLYIYTCTMTTVQFQWHFTTHVQNSPSPQHYVAQYSRWPFVLFCLQSGLLENVDEYSQNILGAQALYNKQPIIFLGYECGSRNFFKSL